MTSRPTNALAGEKATENNLKNGPGIEPVGERVDGPETGIVVKKQLIKRVAVASGYSKKDTRAFVNALFRVIGRSLSKGRSVEVAGFGTFELQSDQARSVRLDTKDKTEIPKGKIAGFKASKAFRARLT